MLFKQASVKEIHFGIAGKDIQQKRIKKRDPPSADNLDLSATYYRAHTCLCAYGVRACVTVRRKKKKGKEEKEIVLLVTDTKYNKTC